MLVTQLYFQVHNLFPVADKTEMPRFNNPGMNGANPDFVQFFAFNLVERIIFDFFIFIGTVVGISHWFQPGMIAVFYSEIFVNFSFKLFEIVVFSREGWQLVAFVHNC